VLNLDLKIYNLLDRVQIVGIKHLQGVRFPECHGFLPISKKKFTHTFHMVPRHILELKVWRATLKLNLKC
jgi:hypothetical protein